MNNHLRENGFGVGPVCRELDLSESAHYARKKRPKSDRRLRDEQLMPLIEEIHETSGGTYGAHRITRALRRKDVDVARCTTERLMAELDIEGVIRGRRRRTWSRGTSPPPAPTNCRSPTWPTCVLGRAGRTRLFCGICDLRF